MSLIYTQPRDYTSSNIKKNEIMAFYQWTDTFFFHSKN